MRDVVRALVLEAALTGSVLVLTGAEAAGAAMDVLTGAPVPVLAVGNQRWDARWARDLPPEVIAPRLSLAQRRQEWRTALGVAEPPREVTALRLTPEEIHVVGRGGARGGRWRYVRRRPALERGTSPPRRADSGASAPTTGHGARPSPSTTSCCPTTPAPRWSG